MIFRLFFSLIIMSVSFQLIADVTNNNESEPSSSSVNISSWEHLETLVAAINATRRQLVEKRNELKEIDDELTREQIREEIKQISLDQQSLKTALEMLSTGAADLSLFGIKTDEEFDWREELQSVFEPILVELKRLSERPRKIERLRNDQAYFQQRLDVAQPALENITRYRKEAPTATLKEAFAALEDRWRKRRDDLQNRLNLIEFELQEILSPAKSSRNDPVEVLKNLLGGRVLNLLIATLVMIAVYVVLRLLARLYQRTVLRRFKRRPTFIARVGNLLFYLLTTLIVLLSGMAVFYIRGDWVLLGLLLIVLAGAALAVQKSLPRFLTEAKLILNLGPVREGEKIIYNGLPWHVKTLSFYATLYNPCLLGGSLQIPVKELVTYCSRRFHEEEPWFPSRTGEWVLLNDNTYGEIVVQTPEYVQLKELDALKTYDILSYIAQNPRNLSANGFTLLINFGLDYQHQKEITGEIRQKMEADLIDGLSAAGISDLVKLFKVEFEKAGASSLDLVAIATFNGEAANQYLGLPRLFQRLAVDTCNKHHWSIPFNQISVHMV